MALDGRDAAVQHTLHGVAVRDGRGIEGGDQVQLQWVAAHACRVPQCTSIKASGCRLKLFYAGRQRSLAIAPMGQHEYIVGNRPSKSVGRHKDSRDPFRARGHPRTLPLLGILLVYDTERFSADQKLRPLRTYMRASAAQAAPASPPSCPPPAAVAGAASSYLPPNLCCHSTAVCPNIGGSLVGLCWGPAHRQARQLRGRSARLRIRRLAAPLCGSGSALEGAGGVRQESGTGGHRTTVPQREQGARFWRAGVHGIHGASSDHRSSSVVEMKNIKGLPWKDESTQGLSAASLQQPVACPSGDWCRGRHCFLCQGILDRDINAVPRFRSDALQTNSLLAPPWFEGMATYVPAIRHRMEKLT